VKGSPRVSAELYERLQFLARVLRHAPRVHGDGPWLLWFDKDGQLASAQVGRHGVVVGRDPACDVVLPGSRVSRRHCAVRVRPGDASGVEVEDLGSSNGTRVNGREIPARTVQRVGDGGVLEAGGHALAVLAGARDR
jgi:predicted component of type VI protein secretion system